MFSVVAQKIGQSFRFFVPFLTTLLFILMGALTWPVPFFSSIAPSLGLVGVYYWAIYRPDLLRPSSVFALGLLNDALQGLPTGLTAALYVGIYQLALSQRRFFVNQIFLMLWSGFVLVAFLAMVLNWIVVSVYNGAAVAFMPPFLQFALTSVLFPLPAWGLIRLQNLLLAQE